MRFLRTFLLASAGFALLDLAVRPPRRRVELTDAGAAAFANLVLLDAELRGDLDDDLPAEPAPRRLCLCDGCSARRRVRGA